VRNIMQGHIQSIGGDALTPSPHGHMLKEDTKNAVPSSWDVSSILTSAQYVCKVVIREKLNMLGILPSNCN
jgi:hypothetical protein